MREDDLPDSPENLMEALTVETADNRKQGRNGLTAARGTSVAGLSSAADTEAGKR